MATIDDRFSILRRATALAPLADPALRRLARVARLERHDRALLLEPAGQPLARLRLVLTGQLSVIAPGLPGAELSMPPIGPGGWALWMASFDGQPLLHALHAAADTRCLVLPTRALRAEARREPQLYEQVLAGVGQRFRSLLAWVEQGGQQPPLQRLAHLLVLAAELGGGDGQRVAMAQAQLAAVLGVARQTVNRLLADLEGRGLIARGYREVRLLDVAQLRAFALGGG